MLVSVVNFFSIPITTFLCSQNLFRSPGVAAAAAFASVVAAFASVAAGCPHFGGCYFC